MALLLPLLVSARSFRWWSSDQRRRWSFAYLRVHLCRAAPCGYQSALLFWCYYPVASGAKCAQLLFLGAGVIVIIKVHAAPKNPRGHGTIIRMGKVSWRVHFLFGNCAISLATDYDQEIRMSSRESRTHHFWLFVFFSGCSSNNSSWSATYLIRFSATVSAGSSLIRSMSFGCTECMGHPQYEQWALHLVCTAEQKAQSNFAALKKPAINYANSSSSFQSNQST